MYVKLDDDGTSALTYSFEQKTENSCKPSKTSYDPEYRDPILGSSKFLETSLFSAPWDAVCDLDKFLCGIYKYWAEGGFWAILASHVSHNVALLFTIYFSWFLLVFVNWNEIVGCNSEDSCRQVNVLIEKPFEKWGLLQIFSNLYFVVLNIFLLWNIFFSFINCKDAWIVRSYFQHRLRIPSDEALTMLDWPEVVVLLLKAQEESPFCIVEMNITVLDIVKIIMRQDNYLIAMTNRNLFTCAMPPWLPCRYVYSKPLFWNIRTALFMDMFDHRSRVLLHRYKRPLSSSGETSSLAAITLATRFRWLALLNLLFIIPTFLFIIIYFFLKHAEDFRANRSMPFKREFNLYAYWTFREINELPHQLERRLATASFYAEDYVLSGWSNPVLQRFKLCFKYVTGALLAVLLAVYFFDENSLLFVKFYDRNLLWYTIVFGFAYTLMRDSNTWRSGTHGANKGTFVEDWLTSVGSSSHSITHLSPISMYQRCMRVVQYTHFLPPTWRRPAIPSSYSNLQRVPELSSLHKHVMNDFCCNFYIVRIIYLMEELLSVLLTPIVLFFWMPYVADILCDFVANCTCRSTVGDHCCFALFDLKSNGSEFYNAFSTNDDANVEATKESRMDVICNKKKVMNDMVNQALEDTVEYPVNGFNNNRCKLKSYSGKLEKSLLTYVLYYRLPTPYDDSSPMWAVFTTEELLASIMSSARASAITQDHVLSRSPKKDDCATDFDKDKNALIAMPQAAVYYSFENFGRLAAPKKTSVSQLEESVFSCYVSDNHANEDHNFNSSSILAVSNSFSSQNACGDHCNLFNASRMKWGYNDEALKFVERLENFQAEHLKAHPYLQQELPSDLCIDLRTISASNSNAFQKYASDKERAKREIRDSFYIQNFIGPPPILEEVQATYFFWLEKFYEVKSGRIFYPTNQLNHYFSCSS